MSLRSSYCRITSFKVLGSAIKLPRLHYSRLSSSFDTKFRTIVSVIYLISFTVCSFFSTFCTAPNHPLFLKTPRELQIEEERREISLEHRPVWILKKVWRRGSMVLPQLLKPLRTSVWILLLPVVPNYWGLRATSSRLEPPSTGLQPLSQTARINVSSAVAIRQVVRYYRYPNYRMNYGCTFMRARGGDVPRAQEYAQLHQGKSPSINTVKVLQICENITIATRHLSHQLRRIPLMKLSIVGEGFRWGAILSFGWISVAEVRLE